MVSSPGSRRSGSVSSAHSRSTIHSRSKSGSMHRSYSNSDRSRSRTRSSSARRSRSGRTFRSKSHSPYSRSRSATGRRASGSWSRSHSHSRSNSRDRSTYSSRSRSVTRSRSRSLYHRSGHHRYRSSRSHSYESGIRSRSRSHTPNSTTSSLKCGGKDPRDRSKRVKWTNNVWIVGEKAKDTVFHFCDSCDLPIVIYGRLLPCKHVLCYTCAMNLPNKCNRCQKNIQTIERCLVGGIFMCFESDGCRRTYLSQRDLQAHIDHRHRGGISAVSASTNMINNNNTSSITNLKTDVRANNEVCGTNLNAQNFSKDSHRSAGQIKVSTVKETNTHLNTVSLLGPTPRVNPIIPTCGLNSAVFTTTTTTNIITTTPINSATTANSNNQKNDGLLPFPIQTSTSSNLLNTNRLPVGLSCPIRTTNNFTQLSQFPTLSSHPHPTPIVAPTIPPPSSFLTASIPPSSIQTGRAQSLSGASAVAALAAVVSAAINAQSKVSGMNATNIASTIQQASMSTNQIQSNALNATLLTSALRAAAVTNTNWANSANSLVNPVNIRALTRPLTQQDPNLTNPNSRHMQF